VSLITLPTDLLGRALDDLGAIARVARQLPERLDTLEARAEKVQDQLDRALALGETIADNSAAMVELGQHIEARGEAMIELGGRMILLGNSPTAARRSRRHCRGSSAPSRWPPRSRAPSSGSGGPSIGFRVGRDPQCHIQG
jgi:hypothetical protein